MEKLALDESGSGLQSLLEREDVQIYFKKLLDDGENEISFLKNEKKHLQKLIEENETENYSLQQNTLKLSKEIEQKNKKIKDLMKMLEEVNIKSSQQDNNDKSLIHQIDNLKTQLESHENCQRDIDYYEDRVKTSEDAITALEKELDTKNIELKKQMESTTKNESNFQLKINIIEEELLTTKNIIEEKDIEIAQLKDILKEQDENMKQDSSIYKKDISSAGLSIKAEIEMVELKQNLEDANAEIQFLKGEDEKYKTLIKDFEEKLKEAKMLEEKVTNKLKSSENESQILSKKLNKTESCLESAFAKVKLLEQKICDNEAKENISKKNEVNQLVKHQKEVELKNEKISNLLKNLRVLKEREKKLVENETEQQKKIASKDIKIAGLHQELMEKDLELKKLNENLLSLETQTKEMKKDRCVNCCSRQSLNDLNCKLKSSSEQLANLHLRNNTAYNKHIPSNLSKPKSNFKDSITLYSQDDQKSISSVNNFRPNKLPCSTPINRKIFDLNEEEHFDDSLNASFSSIPTSKKDTSIIVPVKGNSTINEPDPKYFTPESKEIKGSRVQASNKDEDQSVTFESVVFKPSHKFAADDFKQPSGGDNDEYRRIAEFQRRNTLVPLHLKSSYPVETQGRTPTRCDEIVRTGLPSDTIRKISMALNSEETPKVKPERKRRKRENIDPSPSKIRRNTEKVFRDSHQALSSLGIKDVSNTASRRQSTAFEITNTPKRRSRFIKKRNKPVASLNEVDEDPQTSARKDTRLSNVIKKISKIGKSNFKY